jgi:AraC family transcriptional regulator
MNVSVMTIQPVIKTIAERKLVGVRLTMSLEKNRTRELWQSFMPRRKELQNLVGTDMYSMQVYDPLYFEAFNPRKAFEKWAAVEVKDFSKVPGGMETCTLQEGSYAIFHYKGASTDPAIYQYIFGAWLPNSTYCLDNRPHFEILGDKYKNADPDSEEQIYIPVKQKHTGA